MDKIIKSVLNFYEDPVVDEEEDKELPPPTPTPKTEEKPKTFSQDDVNRFLADERRKVQRSNERTVKELEGLRKTASLTVEEKETLEARIENLKNEHLSKEELTKKESKKEQEKLKKEKETLVSDRDRWKNLYENTTIDNAIIGAAAPDAHNTNQVLRILKSNTRLIEELDDTGAPTNRLIPKIKLDSWDKDGKLVTLELDPTEAIKQMKEMPEHANLFRSGAVSGLGGTNANYASNSGDVPTDPKAYREYRKKNPL